MKILAIDTSCDDTCIALVKVEKSHFKILSNIISSQVKIHRKWGGVVPTLAKREHQKNIVPVLKKALEEARMLKKSENIVKDKKLKEILIREELLYKKLKNFLGQCQKPQIDLIAVTAGPALEPALWVGVNFAKAISYFWQKPILPVNHIEGHIFANFIQNPISEIKFSAVCLVISGGYTGLILMKDVGEYKKIGETRDDAAGECFDKVAKILGLGYPGGPIISKLAKRPKRQAIHLPRPMILQKNYDFSFSGLKTAVLYDFKSRPPKVRTSKKYIQEICFETQQAIIDVLIRKTIRAAKEFRTKAIILGGGVAANKELRKQFKEIIKKNLPNTRYLIPVPKLCTDNAVMVGVAAFFHQKEATKNWRKIKADANLKI
jgi:N6-L-threonylcarbamoyladenine synthase